MAGLLRFVPYLGSYVAAVGPVLLAAAVEPGWLTALSVAGLFLVTEPLLGQFIEPLLYGRSTGLSPISVVISAIFWGWLWGPIGLIISTAIDAEAQIIVAHELMQCGSDQGQLVPLVEAIENNLGRKPEQASADSGYCSEPNLKALVARGIDGYVAPGRAQHPTAANGRRASPRASQ